MAAPRPLSPKQNRFVAEYLVDGNGTQAAIRAGYSARTAEKIASENLRKPEVKRAIEEAQARRAARVEVKQDDVLRELIRLFSVDIGKAYGPGGKLLPLHEIPEDVRRAIVGIETKELYEERYNGSNGRSREQIGDLVKVKFADKVRCIELAMKHLGLLVDKVKLEGTVTLEQLVLAAAKKPDGAP